MTSLPGGKVPGNNRSIQWIPVRRVALLWRRVWGSWLGPFGFGDGDFSFGAGFQERGVGSSGDIQLLLREPLLVVPMFEQIRHPFIQRREQVLFAALLPAAFRLTNP